MAKIDKGIGMPYVFPEDLVSMNASWYYNWGVDLSLPDRYVPMSWGGDDPNLPLDYDGYCLLFNEPDRPEQANILPEDGFNIYKSLCKKYPLIKWVVGNVSYAQWLYTFKSFCQADPNCIMPKIWGLHCYVGRIDYVQRILDYLDDAHIKLGGDFWMTEFACVFGEIEADKKLTRYFRSRSWIKRWAYFCNRAKGDEWWYPKGWTVRLIDWDTGIPTYIGEWYAKDKAPFLSFLPIIGK